MDRTPVVMALLLDDDDAEEVLMLRCGVSAVAMASSLAVP